MATKNPLGKVKDFSLPENQNEPFIPDNPIPILPIKTDINILPESQQFDYT